VKRELTAMELRERLGEVLDRVALRHDEFVISRKGRPMAAIVPIEKLDRLLRAASAHLLEALERPAEAVSQDEADRLADEAKHSTRT
jgi:prevent-host-death family protein